MFTFTHKGKEAALQKSCQVWHRESGPPRRGCSGGALLILFLLKKTPLGTRFFLYLEKNRFFPQEEPCTVTGSYRVTILIHCFPFNLC